MTFQIGKSDYSLHKYAAELFRDLQAAAVYATDPLVEAYLKDAIKEGFIEGFYIEPYVIYLMRDYSSARLDTNTGQIYILGL